MRNKFLISVIIVLLSGYTLPNAYADVLDVIDSAGTDQGIPNPNPNPTPTPTPTVDPCSNNTYALPKGCPGSADINAEFRNNAKNQIDSTLNMLRPSNAPDLLPNSFKQQILDDPNNAGIPALISFVAGIIASIAGLVAMINILYNSYLYISSKGDTGKTGKAVKAITWSLIGLVGIIFSYNIVYSVIRLIYEQTANGGI
ncbi:MAG: hypothetical protein ACK4NC_00040 [Candidatus Gracilibacteria bacterium]